MIDKTCQALGLKRIPLSRHVILVDGIRSKKAFLAFAERLGQVYLQADDPHKEGMVTLHADASVHKYGFTTQALFPHTDRSNMQNPPNAALFWYEQEAGTGGESLIFDAEQHLLPIIDTLNFAAVFASENDTNQMKAPLYDRARHLFRFRNDDYIFIEQAEDRAKFQKVQGIIEAHTQTLTLKQGQCLILNNHLIFHGRTLFTGSRIIHRILLYQDQGKLGF